MHAFTEGCWYHINKLAYAYFFSSLIYLMWMFEDLSPGLLVGYL